ncbi:hypothetical protein VTK73DRAFT_6640 [Phialemonium thermophilum]|uniref:Velvet domain-containing protein n=1 Tax=Phialemonium thermophilum TaxID=223376 RepID=A0ABR3XW42_9PEZI
MNHPYPPHGQAAHGLPHDYHQLPHPSTSSYPAPPSVPQLPSMAPPPPSAGYADPYGQPPSAPEPGQSSTSPTQGAKSAELQALSRENLKPYSSTDGTRRYALDVVQQPQRARMCGFGDKDRRPITPPPCVRLIITDVHTGKEVDVNEIEYTMYVLNVDLWSEDATKEVNLVRHTTATPSISSTTPASFATLEHSTPAYAHILPSNRQDYSAQVMPQSYHAASVNPYAQQGYQGFMQPNGYSPATPYFSGDFQQPVGLPSQSVAYVPPRVYDPMAMNHRLSLSGSQPQGMFTRNLIGSLAASAFRLIDPSNKIGIWFVLQDLSVRTEGLFRLRFSFVNVGPPLTNGQPNTNSIVNTGKAPVLASCFSDVFQVYSAKKFPGVCESTGLSKCFANQGIKIPIRKEGANSKSGNQDDDDYD